MIFRYSAPAYISRRLVEGALGAADWDVQDIEPDDRLPFPCQLVKPNNDEATTVATSPRDLSPWRIRWRGGFQAPSGGPLQAGERVFIQGREYEVISAARQVDEGRTLLEVWEVRAQPISELYPYPGVLREFDSTNVEDVEDWVHFSLFANSESHADTGMYEDFGGECPLDYEEFVKVNRQIEYSSSIYKIVNVEMDQVGHFLSLTLRRAGG